MIVPVVETWSLLQSSHYLGPTKRGKFAWMDEDGCMVFANPSSRHLPKNWLELTRWCIIGGAGAGSRQWSRFSAFAKGERPETTVVSYSDPAQGHTGALYRACNWWWAPTWHRLRPPPSGNGSWDGVSIQSVKDRWVFLLRPDVQRKAALSIKDPSCLKDWAFASYKEPDWPKKGQPHPCQAPHKLFSMLQ